MFEYARVQCPPMLCTLQYTRTLAPDKMAKKKTADSAPAQQADKQRDASANAKGHAKTTASKEAAAEVSEARPASKKRAKDEIDEIFGSSKKKEVTAENGEAGNEQLTQELQDIAHQVAQERVGAAAAGLCTQSKAYNIFTMGQACLLQYDLPVAG